MNETAPASVNWVDLTFNRNETKPEALPKKGKRVQYSLPQVTQAIYVM